MSHKIQGLIMIIVTTMVILLCFEVTLRIMNFGDPRNRRDPFFGFEGTSRIFEKREVLGKGEYYISTPQKQRNFNVSFPVIKQKDELRVFTFGGSTTAGVPWGRQGAFSAFLEEYLVGQVKGKKVEVINLGVAGRASTRVFQIMKEAVDYSPDLLVVYTGQNEFRDARFHANELLRPRFVSTVMKTLFMSRTVYWFYEKWQIIKAKTSGKRTISYGAKSIEKVIEQPFNQETFKAYSYYRLPGIIKKSSQAESSANGTVKQKVNDLLGDRVWGLLKYLSGRSWISEEKVFEIFKTNIANMVELAKERNIPIIFLSKSMNFKKMNRLSHFGIQSNALRIKKVEYWQENYLQGIKEIESGNFQQALVHFNEVKESYNEQDQNSDYLLNLYLGECYENLGLSALAIQSYKKNLIEMHETLNVILKEITAKNNVSVIDVESLFMENSPQGIVGYNFFIDGAHMTLFGYKLIGFYLGAFLCQQGFLECMQNSSDNDESVIPKRDEVEVVPELFETEEVMASLGWRAFHRENLQEALDKGGKAVQLNNKHASAHLLLGYGYNQLKMYEKARREWEVLQAIWLQRLSNR